MFSTGVHDAVSCRRPFKKTAFLEHVPFRRKGGAPQFHFALLGLTRELIPFSRGQKKRMAFFLIDLYSNFTTICEGKPAKGTSSKLDTFRLSCKIFGYRPPLRDESTDPGAVSNPHY